MTANSGDHVEDLILAELDRGLNSVERGVVGSHILTCADCARFRMEQRALQQSVAGRSVPSMELSRAHDLIWSRIAQPRVVPAGGFWRTAWGATALTLAVVIAVGLVLALGLTQGVARPDTRTIVLAQQDISLTPGGGTLTVTERLGPDGARQVVVTADLRLAPPPAEGLLEIRTQQIGESYGVLARAPVLAGVSHAHIEGSFPALPRGASGHYNVSVHLEADGRAYDSTPIPLTITSDRTGVHAQTE